MEPVPWDRSHSSLDLGPLSWEDARLCERSGMAGRELARYGRVKVLKQALTCLRALPGDRVTTSALASGQRPVRR
jgi:hypothetical protein